MAANAIKTIGGIAFGLALVAAFVFLASAMIYGAVFIGDKALPSVNTAATVALAIAIFCSPATVALPIDTKRFFAGFSDRVLCFWPPRLARRSSSHL
jgi:hypothetical protein